MTWFIGLFLLCLVLFSRNGFPKQIIINEKEAEGFSVEGHSFMKTKNNEMALISFLKATQLDNANPQTWLNLGQCQFEVGEYSDARLSLMQGLKLKPNDVLMLETLKKIEETLGSIHLIEVNNIMIDAQRIRSAKYEYKYSNKDPKQLIRPKPPLRAPTSQEGDISVVECLTTKGTIYIEVFNTWAPLGAMRFLDLVNSGFFSKMPLFKVLRESVAHFGVSGNSSLVEHRCIQDDVQWLKRPRQFNKGFISFAGTGPNTRNTQLFIALSNLPLGDAPHEVPFGRVITSESFKTMAEWYGEFEGVETSSLQEEMPLVDSIVQCQVMAPLARTSPALSSSTISSSSTTILLPSYEQSPGRIKLQGSGKSLETRLLSPPAQPLPIYLRASAVTFPRRTNSHDVYWWLPWVRARHEERRDLKINLKRKKKTAEMKPDEVEAPDRYVLYPNEVHVVDDFLSKKDRVEFRKLILDGRRRPGKKEEMIHTVHLTLANDAVVWAGYPSAFVNSQNNVKQFVVDILTKVSEYVNENIVVNGTLGGQHQFSDDQGIHLAMFVIYEYVPDGFGKQSRVTPHTDSDYDGRCLSAAVHLDNWIPLYSKKKQQHTNVAVEGGVFEVMRCVEPLLDCTGAVGSKLAELHDRGVFDNDDTLEVTEEAVYRPGRLVLFLPETPHKVTPLTRGTRAILFMWFNCGEWETVPVKHPLVAAAVERAEERREKKKNTTSKRNINKSDQKKRRLKPRKVTN